MVRPRVAVLENVAALLHRGMGTVLGSLAQIGFDTEWHSIPASRIGAPHERDRIWIIATDIDQDGQSAGALRAEVETPQTIGDTDEAGRENAPGGAGSAKSAWRTILAPADVERRSRHWEAEPPLVRVVHGISGELDEADPDAVAALGNSVVPEIPYRIGQAIIRTI
jgi:DNA (cytosine-5)-methyltransferase 1